MNNLFRTLRTSAYAAFLLLLAVQFTACDSNDDEDPAQDIVDVAIANDLSTLVTAVEAADLVGTLEGEGPFTVFAPTDAAFENLPAGTLESLLQPENQDQLTAVLTYHVVPGRVTAEEVVNLESATTLQGATVDIEVTDGNVFINGARVVTANVEASNGVVHVIDAVLLPPTLD